MQETQRTFWPTSIVGPDGGFNAMDMALADFLSWLRGDYRGYRIIDRTVIAATLADGRKGFVVGIEYEVDTERLGK
jgi:hypothetical protein